MVLDWVKHGTRVKHPMDCSYKKRENRKKGKRGDRALENP